MRRDSDESAPPTMLHPSRTRSPEASMGHLPGNPAEEPDSARSGGHLPGKSPWADAGSTSPPPWQALGALSGRAHEGFSAGLRAGDAVRASGGRSWPSQSEAGAARTRFPRRPRRVTASRETWHFERTTASRELQCPSAAFHKRAQIRCYRPMFAIDSLISPMLYRLPKATISPDLPAICIATRKPSSMLPAM